MGKMLKSFLNSYTIFNLARCESIDKRADTLLMYSLSVNSELTAARREDFKKVVSGSNYTIEQFQLSHKATVIDNFEETDSSSQSSSSSSEEEETVTQEW